MLEFNDWVAANATHTEPPMTLLDTTSRSPVDTAALVSAWVRERL
ncbi:hypothetical protein OG921_07800 [Aldersonia sp. NBC_00410]|nr:hypothetical protein [Aldersonia sp. NBC_00410]MCX5043071.1 hypothetical protein [Aldersonia sp. NBC_00410]